MVGSVDRRASLALARRTSPHDSSFSSPSITTTRGTNNGERSRATIATQVNRRKIHGRARTKTEEGKRSRSNSQRVTKTSSFRRSTSSQDRSVTATVDAVGSKVGSTRADNIVRGIGACVARGMHEEPRVTSRRRRDCRWPRVGRARRFKLD